MVIILFYCFLAHEKNEITISSAYLIKIMPPYFARTVMGKLKSLEKLGER
jgi:hypothetical protein